jgi:hypothetical protein
MILEALVQVLSNPAWQGAGVIASSALSLLALRNSYFSSDSGFKKYQHIVMRYRDTIY